jgi:putative peptide zinc metalloprotease protein
VNLAKLAARLCAAARSARAALHQRPPRQPDRPRLTPAVELIGEYKDSGFKESPYIVRRPDGQIVQLSRLLYLVAAEADGGRDLEQLATAVSQRFGRPLSADNVAFLIDAKLRPAGLICPPHGATPATVRRADPLLALRYRAAVVPPRFVRAGARVLRPLFLPLVVGAALSWLLALDVWLAGHGLGGAVRQLFAHPVLLLALLALVIVSAVWHEFGHATACRYSGASPGAMGVGLYVIWPAFYTDVTDAYRLRRAGRLRTDLGGVYFNALFALAAGGAYFATHFEPLLALVAVQHFQIIQQLTPLMRLDGYYVVTDLVGVPDVLSRVKPLLLSLVPFRAADPRVTELKPWVRAATGAYILFFVIALGALLVLLALNAPRVIPAAVHSAELYSHRAATAWHRHAPAAAALAEIQVLTVMLPALGAALGVVRLLRRLAARAAKLVDRRLRLALSAALVAGIGFAWPYAVDAVRGELHPRDARASLRGFRPHKQPSSPRARNGHRHAQPPAIASTTAGFTTTSSPARSTGAATSTTRHTSTGITQPASSRVTSHATAASAQSPNATTASNGTPTAAPAGGPTTTPTSRPAGSSGGGTGGTTPSGSGAPSTTGTSTTPTTQTNTTPTNTTSTTTSTTPTTTSTTTPSSP